jgi:hypothetical protein
MESDRVEAIVDVLATGVARPAKWALYAFLVANAGLWAVALVLGLGEMISFPERDISDRKPYVDFIGREYWLKTAVDALAWNDFPDKATIVSISLMPPPSVRNRFVSYTTRLKAGQRLRIISAKGRFLASKDYVVSVPGAGLPDEIPITIPMNSDGTPDPRVYALVGN